MKRFSFFFAVLLGGFLLIGADGCSSDPNVEGAKLDLRNKDYDRALENLAKALETDPNNAEAYALKGQVLQEQAFTVSDPDEHGRKLQEMMESYNRAVEIDPGQAGTINNQLSLAYFNEFQRGVQAFNRGAQAEDGAAEFDASAGYFSNAAMMRPDSVDAYMNQAYALIRAQRTDDAIEPFEMAVEKGDTSPDTYEILSGLYLENGDGEKAVTLLETATEQHPANEALRARLLNAYVTSGQMDRALQRYQQEVNSDPDNKLYRYNYGSLLLEAERYQEAIEQLVEAVRIDPEYGNAQYNLGAAYINMAVGINEEITALDDKRRNDSSISDAEKKQLETQIDEMVEQRRSIFQEAIAPLEKAKALAEAAGEEVTGICGALFSAYAQTGQTDKAEAVSECAGYEDMN